MPAVIIRGQPVKTEATPSTVSHALPTGTVAVEVLSSVVIGAAASARTYILMQNTGSNPVYVDLTGAAAAVGDCFLLAASGGSLELTHWVPQNAITAIGDGGTSKLEILCVGGS
jgi:hypothetical protein